MFSYNQHFANTEKTRILEKFEAVLQTSRHKNDLSF